MFLWNLLQNAHFVYILFNVFKWVSTSLTTLGGDNLFYFLYLLKFVLCLCRIIKRFFRFGGDRWFPRLHRPILLILLRADYHIVSWWFFTSILQQVSLFFTLQTMLWFSSFSHHAVVVFILRCSSWELLSVNRGMQGILPQYKFPIKWWFKVDTCWWHLTGPLSRRSITWLANVAEMLRHVFSSWYLFLAWPVMLHYRQWPIGVVALRIVIYFWEEFVHVRFQVQNEDADVPHLMFVFIIFILHKIKHRNVYALEVLEHQWLQVEQKVICLIL